MVGPAAPIRWTRGFRKRRWPGAHSRPGPGGEHCSRPDWRRRACRASRQATGTGSKPQMPQLNTETLLEGVTPDEPSGSDLSYDPAYMELERISQGAPQDRIVGPDGPAEGPDWRVVQKQALALLVRTKDLRVATLLAKALVHTGGFAGFREGTSLLRELLTRYWDTLHPQMLEEDDFSPIMRGN